jgi:DNA-binding MarR family transcriptional regulator
VRDAHRAFQRVLERRIARFGVTRGQWYFLRVLWIRDGLTQRELSARVGMMEPTTVIALKGMERAGLVRRARSREDGGSSTTCCRSRARSSGRRRRGSAGGTSRCSAR